MADPFDPLRAAPIAAVTVVLTVEAEVTVKLAVLVPAFTVTVAGPVAASGLLLLMAIEASVNGALVRVTDAVLVFPPAAMDAGVSIRLATCGPLVATAEPSTFNSATAVHGPPLTSLSARKRT